MKRFLLILVAVAVLAAAWSSLGDTNRAAAQPPEGTLLADLVVPNSDGLGIGFDGTHLYWVGFDNAILHKITTGGAFVADIPIAGCTASVISWDASRNVFWGIEGFAGGQVSQIDTAGNCTPQFVIPECQGLVDGIDYDPSDDTLWCSPDGSVVVYHYTTGGVPAAFASFRVDIPPDDTAAQCGFNYNSGIATGADPNAIYLAADGCDTIFRYDKQTGQKVSWFVIGAERHEDMECDDVTFEAQNTDAVWIKDAFDDHIRAFAVEEGTCVITDQPPEAACVETVNPHGKTVPPAGSTTLPGPKGGQDEDGYYELLARDAIDPDPDIFVVDKGKDGVFGTADDTTFGPYPSGTKVKYTEANGATPNAKPIGGPNSAVDWHITGNGDMGVYAVDAAGNASDHVQCHVPPPPK